MFAPPLAPGQWIDAMIPSSSFGMAGGLKSGPIRYSAMISSAWRRSSGVKSIRSSSVSPYISYGAGRVGNGWVGEVFSPGTSDCGTGRSSIGHTGSPVSRLNT